jgi:hypothetical protein
LPVNPEESVPGLYVDDLLITEVNEAEMNAHAIGVEEALSVLEIDQYELFANASGDPSAAPLVIVGPSSYHSLLTIPVDPTDVDGLYRPRTAYPSGREQTNRYRQRRGKRTGGRKRD